MFISINKGVFDDDVTEEINVSLKMFEDKMNQTETPHVKKRLKTGKFELQESVKLNNSIMIENQIVLFFQVGPNSPATYHFPPAIAPRNNIEVRTFHELAWYGNATITTGGEIHLSENAMKEDTWIYATWIVARNDLIK